jgi:matrixin
MKAPRKRLVPPVNREFVGLVVPATVWFAAFAAGCGTSLQPTEESGVLTVYEGLLHNGDFAFAQPATLPTAGEIVIKGSIELPGDVDVYDLGPAAAGDAVVADVIAQDGLNAVAALFDGGETVIDANNDRLYYGGNPNPLMSQTIRVTSGNLYLGIAASTATHFATPSGSPTGAYSVRVSRQPGRAVNPPRPQIVWLDFEGGDSVEIGSEPVVVMLPFTAEAMSVRFVGQTEYIIDRLLALMRQDLAPYNVTLLDSRHHTEPTEAHSTVFFGNYHALYPGIADSVDAGNKKLEGEAIVFSEDLTMFESLQPTADEAAQALANFAAHELGHLLGLEHTSEPGDLMSTTSTSRQILELNAEYRRARLESAVFPIGWQNSEALLLLNVGRNPSENARWRRDDLIPANNRAALRDLQGIPDVLFPMCRNCAGQGCGR